MKAVLPIAIIRFHESYPGIELNLRTTTYEEGVWLLMDSESDLHCGGIDSHTSLPQFLVREHILDMTWGIVAHKDHPLQSASSTTTTWPTTPGLITIRLYRSRRPPPGLL